MLIVESGGAVRQARRSIDEFHSKACRRHCGCNLPGFVVRHGAVRYKLIIPIPEVRCY